MIPTQMSWTGQMIDALGIDRFVVGLSASVLMAVFHLLSRPVAGFKLGPRCGLIRAVSYLRPRRPPRFNVFTVGDRTNETDRMLEPRVTRRCRPQSSPN